MNVEIKILNVKKYKTGPEKLKTFANVA